jgi:LmbE family N-acetylglucosaminyl deacetylase
MVGADVKIVFMTDGSRSHSSLIAPGQLVSIRASEAVAAARELGVEEQDVAFLGFRDGALGKNRDAAISEVLNILNRHQPDQVFFPYYQDVELDHIATNEVVVSALQRWQRRVKAFEYPIWAWYHWPCVSVPLGTRRGAKTILTNSYRTWFGLRLLKDCRSFIPIRDVITQKRAALDQHESQMVRRQSDPNWLTLHDVSDGQFLECFFQEAEVFRHYQLN